MFRRRFQSLPPDPIFEPDLQKLGFFINGEDQIRRIQHPEMKFQYKVNQNDRWNEVHKEANNLAIRHIVNERLLELGFKIVRLPLGAAEDENHVPIFVTNDIATKDRVLLIFGERSMEPGILSWRIVGEEGIKHGSLCEFAKTVLTAPAPKAPPSSTPEKNTTATCTGHTTSTDSTPGIIVANPGQLLWYRGGGRAVSYSEWRALPRQTAVHDAPQIDPIRNKIPGNNDYEEHVHYVMEKVIPSLLKKDAKIDIIGAEFTSKAAVEYLAKNWNLWSSRVTGIAMITPQHRSANLIAQDASSAFVNFISKRCRAYFVSKASAETLIAGRQEFGCNCYASGEHFYEENTLVRSWRHILDWFNMLHVNPEHEEIEFDVVEQHEEVKLDW